MSFDHWVFLLLYEVDLQPVEILTHPPLRLLVVDLLEKVLNFLGNRVCHVF
jgi:hypothetical protein